ncbi:rhamnose-binding lectin-like [Trichomycterus rosablanca]|uniref:rhamnose-binding lectin-like n=1 Tax=Trichomycterus rosablanca TaxID=2290929 RepID=UPI002F356F26
MMSLKLSLLTLLIVAPALLISAENVISCSGNVQRLSCDSGVINTQSVLYGRKTQNRCNVNRIAAELANTNCSSIVTSTIAGRCNGLKVCEFKTDLLGLADPCPGTYKYVNTTYSCISARTNVICENSYGTLFCANGSISVRTAMYGRITPKTCASGLASSLVNNNNCSFNAHDKVVTQCNGKAQCTLFASNYNFTDVCSETRKYLSVTYVCAANPPKTVLACDGSNAILSCGTRTIKVLKANYGRTDSSTCSAGLAAAQISNTNCYRTDSLTRVSTSCNGKSNCVVAATTVVFGDPCIGTNKYLNIEYTCV